MPRTAPHMGAGGGSCCGPDPSVGGVHVVLCAQPSEVLAAAAAGGWLRRLRSRVYSSGAGSEGAGGRADGGAPLVAYEWEGLDGVQYHAAAPQASAAGAAAAALAALTQDVVAGAQAPRRAGGSGGAADTEGGGRAVAVVADVDEAHRSALCGPLADLAATGGCRLFFFCQARSAREGEGGSVCVWRGGCWAGGGRLN